MVSAIALGRYSVVRFIARSGDWGIWGLVDWWIAKGVVRWGLGSGPQSIQLPVVFLAEVSKAVMES